jgi:hypothetical protein
MATYDRTSGTTSARSLADSRLSRRIDLDWSSLFGGSLIGWGALLLLWMISMAAASNTGAAIWGAASAVPASFLGGFAVVRLAGDRRRGESLTHAAVAWGMSMLLAGLIALFAPGAAALTRTQTGNGAVVAIFATGGALLALLGSLLGALAASSRTSGVPFSDEFRLTRRQQARRSEGTILTGSDIRRDQSETTILPPTH